MLYRLVCCLVARQVNQSLLDIIDFQQEQLLLCKREFASRNIRIRFKNYDRIVLAKMAKNLGTAICKYATVVTPQTLMRWYRELIAQKFDSSDVTRKVGRPPIASEIVACVIQIASQNQYWGYQRVHDAVEGLGYCISKTKVRDIMIRHGFPPHGKRNSKSTWHQFLRQHGHVIWATDFFTQEVMTRAGLVTYYVLFFINIRTRKVVLGGMTPNPNEQWMKQIARNLTMCDGELEFARCLIHDNDGKYCPAFDRMLRDSGIKPIPVHWHSPNLNGYAERFVRSIKEECLNHFIHLGEDPLRYCIHEYLQHYHHERHHQGLDGKIPFPDERSAQSQTGEGKIVCKERLGGLLKYYYREAA